MNETITIILDLPDPYLSPNKPAITRGGRMKKWRLTQKCRKQACKAVKDERVETGPWTMAEGRAIFYHAQKRRRDGANFNAMLKGYIDGVVDSGLLIDDDEKHWTLLPPEFRLDKYPRLELTITRRD